MTLTPPYLGAIFPSQTVTLPFSPFLISARSLLPNRRHSHGFRFSFSEFQQRFVSLVYLRFHFLLLLISDFEFVETLVLLFRSFIPRRFQFQPNRQHLFLSRPETPPPLHHSISVRNPAAPPLPIRLRCHPNSLAPPAKRRRWRRWWRCALHAHLHLRRRACLLRRRR